MTEEEAWTLLNCEQLSNGDLKVRSREKSALEFKQVFDTNCFKKSVKTIAAFANCDGGYIVFGVTNRPRMVCGTTCEMDEADIQNILTSSLYPIPDVELFEITLDGKTVFFLKVTAINRPPVIATNQLQTQERKNETVLMQGLVYYRRAGQTRPATGAEFGALLEKRDVSVRTSILSVITKASEVGFDKVAVADFRSPGASKEQVTLWVPEAVAKGLNVIDRGRLVQDGGAPAYELRGTIKATLPRKKDPRKPLLPNQSARVIRKAIREVFWAEMPWAPSHLKIVTKHLGFWPSSDGDSVHTDCDELTQRPMYYEEGRAAVERFIRQNPDEFIDVVGSKATKTEWRKRKRDAIV